MKKLMLLIIVVCLVLAGCAQSKADTKAPETGSTGTDVTEQGAASSAEQDVPATIVSPRPDMTMENLTDAILSISLEKGDAYVDDEGKEITGCVYDKAEPFRNGRARVCRHGKWGYVDLGGKEVVQPVYDALGEFYPGNSGLAMVKSGECYGFIKRNGDVAIPIVYDYCDSRFEEGRVRVQLHGRWGFLDQFGCDVIPLLYDDAEAFYGGYAAVMQDGEWLLIDADGNRFSETDKNKRR